MRYGLLGALLALTAILTGCSTKAERLYNRAEAFFAQEQMQLAANEYESLADEFDRHPLADDALYKVAYIYAEETDKPSLALVRYRRLADRYPQSPYVDDALLRIMDIQRAVLKDPGAVQGTCEELCQRFKDRKQLCARGMLTVASTWFDTGGYEEATLAAQTLIDHYSGQERQCAQAALLIARATEKQGDLDRDTIVALYEKVVEAYPGTHSAATAKRIIGWMYYEVRGEHEQQQRTEMKERSRIIRGVPPHGGASGQGQALSALRSALAHRGEDRSLQELAAMSGVAFELVFDPARPRLGQAIFAHNPFETIAARLGFAYNVWSSGTAAEAFDSAHQALLQGHPVIVLYGSDSAWVLLTGYDMEAEQVSYLPPDRDGYATASKDTFLAQWAAASGGASAMAPGKFYQFSLAARLRTPPPAEVVAASLQQATELMGAGELAGAASGVAALERLAIQLEQCADPEATQAREQVAEWATHSLAARLSNAQSGTALLRKAADEVPSAAARLNELAESHREVTEETQLLADKIAEASGEAPPEEIWETAAAQASFVAALHSRFVEQLNGVLGQLSQ